MAAHGPLEIFTCKPETYRYLMDHPDKTVKLWRRLGAKCIEIEDRGGGVFGWKEGVSDVHWEVVRDAPHQRVWYAEGLYKPALLVPAVSFKAVLVLDYVEGKDGTGKSAVRHQMQLILHTDNKAVALATKVMGASAPKMAEQFMDQLQMFYAAMAWFLDQHPDRAGKMFASLQQPDPPGTRLTAPIRTTAEGETTPTEALTAGGAGGVFVYCGIGRAAEATPMDKPPLTYQAAGLDLDLYEQTLAGMAPLLRRTHTPRVLDGFGGFASLFSLDYNSRLFARNYRHPVIIACTDGVGSKLKVASLANKHDTVGIDLVAMSVNDCLCTGGEPLIFLDYLAMPKDDPALTRNLIKGVSDGCLEGDCAWSAARRRSCRTSINRAITTWRASASAWSSATASSTAAASRWATRCWAWRAAACTLTATAWCARSCSSGPA